MSGSREHGPPKPGLWILRQVYGHQMFDEVYGDLHELYLDNLSKGRLRADVSFLADTVLSVRNYRLRTSTSKTQNNSIAMFRNFTKITFRMLTKNKVYSTLNIAGLALGIAAFLFILQYVTYERSYDKFHSEHENLYRIRYKVIRSGDLQIDCAAAVPRVGPFMKENMPEVIDFARAYPMSGVVSVNNIKFREDRIHIVDPGFLKIFDYPLVKGNIDNVLSEPNQVVITENMAEKYFGSTDAAIGKFIQYNSWLDLSLEVTGITRDVPHNSHLKYDFLISYETLNNQTRNDDGTSSSETAWGWYDYNTYVLLQPNTDPQDYDARFAEILFQERGERFEQYDYKQEFPLQPITDIHLFSDLLQESEPEEQGDGQAVFFLTLISFFILIIAWINYINLSTARSVERAKEVGIRKTMGAYRRQLIYQFISESLILNFISLLFALIIVVLGIQKFNDLTGSRLSMDFLSSGTFWAISGGVFVFGSILAGLYPAFVLSSFRPVSVLKGKFSGNRTGILLRRSLVIFQFTASVTLIAGTIIVYRQLDHMNSIDLGFNKSETLVVKGPSVFGADSLYESTFQTFRNTLLQMPEVAAVTSSTNVPGDEIFWTRGIKRETAGEDEVSTIYLVGVDYDYFPLYDIEMVAGRNFEATFTTDTGSIVVNEATTRLLGFQDPGEAINEKVIFAGNIRTIVGVVDDYQQLSLKTQVNPIVFPLVKASSRYFTLKLKSAQYQSAFSRVEEAYQRFFPGNPFDYFFLDEFYNRQYANERNFSRVFTLFAGFAIIVACLGLFGLSSYSAIQRTKEIGIRKAIGADVSNIILLLSKEYVVLIIIAVFVATPVTYLIMDGWLNNFTSRIDVGALTFLISGLFVLIIALLTVGYKTLVTAKANPVGALRYE